MRRTSTSIWALLAAAAMTPALAQKPSEPAKTHATEAETVSETARAPVGEKPGGMTNKDWWPSRLDLTALRQHEAMSNPYGADYDYAAEFASLDLDAVKADIRKVLTTSQPWWPADYGH